MRLEGLIAACHSPMTPDGGLAPERVDDQARHLARSGRSDAARSAADDAESLFESMGIARFG